MAWIVADFVGWWIDGELVVVGGESGVGGVAIGWVAHRPAS